MKPAAFRRRFNTDVEKLFEPTEYHRSSDDCGECGCNIAGCSNCLDSMLGCGSDEDGNSCECGQEGGGGIGGNAADGCGTECASGTDKTEMCNNDCGFP